MKLGSTPGFSNAGDVSLFTREWIEIGINTDNLNRDLSESPSLRGSGLKFETQKKSPELVSESPSLRGSGLKYIGAFLYPETKRLPLYEGVD